MTADDLVHKFSYIYPGYTAQGLERVLLNFGSAEGEVRWDLAFDKDYRIEHYQRRNDEIRRYFHGRSSSLLTIDLSKEPGTGRICDFLGIPRAFAIRTPHLNKTS